MTYYSFLFFIFLFLLLLSFSPAQRVSYIILPTSLLVAILLFNIQDISYFLASDITLSDKNTFSPRYGFLSGSFLLILFGIIRISSLWIGSIILAPLRESIMHVKNSPLKILTILIQSYLFLSIIDSDLFWYYLLENDFAEPKTLFQYIEKFTFGTFFIILPAALCGIIVSVSLLILSALINNVEKRTFFSDIISFSHAIALLLCFYYTLPFLNQATESIFQM